MNSESAGPRRIIYRFFLEDHHDKIDEFVINLDPNTGRLWDDTSGNSTFWTKLDFHQCKNCPLVPEESPDCPFALAIADIVNRFEKVLSYDKVLVEVELPEREIISMTSAQKSISSIMGLRIAGSGCPHTDFFKPMARFHLPMSSVEETIFRATASYLISQYFRHRDGGDSDISLEGLTEIYQNMHTINTTIADRIRAAVRTDSTLNALVILDLFTYALPQAVQQSLCEIEELFGDFFQSQKKIAEAKEKGLN